MPRGPNLVPSALLHLALPEPVKKQLDDYLVQRFGQIRRGTYQKFFVEILNDYFKDKS